MPTFIQLSDLHLPEPGALLYGLDPFARLDAAIADILARHGPGSACPVDFAVLSGDLADRGDPAAYRALAVRLARLPFPSHLMVGNHDDRGALLAAFPATKSIAGGFIQDAFQTDAGRVILLDTLCPGAAHGELCAGRLAWLDAELSRSSGPVLLFMHHPPVAIGIASIDRLRLADAAALLGVLGPYKARVRHIFCGHVHRPVFGQWHGMNFSAVRGLGHQLALDFTATSNFPGCLEPPCYALVRASEAELVVHLHDFLDRSATFNL